MITVPELKQLYNSCIVLTNNEFHTLDYTVN